MGDNFKGVTFEDDKVKNAALLLNFRGISIMSIIWFVIVGLVCCCGLIALIYEVGKKPDCKVIG